MRRIKITDELINKVDSLYKNQFDKQKITDQLIDLSTKRGYKCGKYNKYLLMIINNYDIIQRLKPSEFDTWKDKFDSIIPSSKITTKFYNTIVDKMGYSGFRQREYLRFAQELQIKSCAYCNAQLTTIADVEFYKRSNKKKGQLKGDVRTRYATFELDHFIAKSEYPFLATSFFNLIPSCAYCNKSKSANSVDFHLYSEDENLDFFEFYLKPESIQKYWSSKKNSDLEVELKSGENGNDILTQDLVKRFHINGIYNTQKDIIEDLLHKREAYRNAYKKGLTTLANRSIFPDEAMIDRLLIGTYTKKEEIHKRPLTKFTQDIARQLKLIP